MEIIEKEDETYIHLSKTMYFWHGYYSYWNDSSIDDNPYAHVSTQSDDWMAGWYYANSRDSQFGDERLFGDDL